MKLNFDKKEIEIDSVLISPELWTSTLNYLNSRPRGEVNEIAVGLEQSMNTEINKTQKKSEKKEKKDQ